MKSRVEHKRAWFLALWLLGSSGCFDEPQLGCPEGSILEDQKCVSCHTTECSGDTVIEYDCDGVQIGKLKTCSADEFCLVGACNAPTLINGRWAIDASPGVQAEKVCGKYEQVTYLLRTVDITVNGIDVYSETTDHEPQFVYEGTKVGNKITSTGYFRNDATGRELVHTLADIWTFTSPTEFSGTSTENLYDEPTENDCGTIVWKITGERQAE